MAKTDFKTIDEYISTFPEDVQQILEEVRQTIQRAVPEAKEVISYQMPTFKLQRNLVHFAAHKDHIGFYPTPSAIEAFKEELSSYKSSKGSVQFPTDKPMPFNLISEVAKYRAKEELEKEQKRY